MKRLVTAVLLCIATLPGATNGAEREEIGGPFFDLVEDGRPAATIVVPAQAGTLLSTAVAAIVDTTLRWSGVRPRVVRLAKNAALPPGNVLIPHLGAPETSATLAARAASPAGNLLTRLRFADEQGFAIDSWTEGTARRVAIVSRTPRGIYNGAI